MKNGDQFLAQLLVPINLNKLKREDELNIYDAYSADLKTQQEFTQKMESKVRIISHRPGKTKPSL